MHANIEATWNTAIHTKLPPYNIIITSTYIHTHTHIDANSPKSQKLSLISLLSGISTVLYCTPIPILINTKREVNVNKA